MSLNIQYNQAKASKVVCIKTCIRLIFLSIFIFTVNTAGARQRLLSPPEVVPPVAAPSLDDPVGVLGFHAHEPTTIPDAASIGHGSIRLWDTGTDWASIEPEQGVYNFDRINEYLAESEAAGLKVIWTIGNTPQWASSRPDEACAYGFGCAAPPSNIKDWRDYVRTIATKFKGRIECYEVWNEVSFPYDPQFEPGAGGDPNFFFSGDVSDIVELTRVAYEEIKQADPNACVLSPSFHDAGNWGMKLDRFLAQGGAQYIDVVSQHFYFDQEPEDAVSIIQFMKKVMVNNGIGEMPVWDTEVGYGFFDKASQWTTITKPDVVYSLTLRTYLTNMSEGVDQIYWYAFDDEGFGYFDPSTGHDFGTAAANAANHLLDNMKSVQCTESNAVWQCKVEETNGNRFKVAWLQGVNATPRSFVLTGDATRWGLVPKSFLAGQTIGLDARPVVINGW